MSWKPTLPRVLTGGLLSAGAAATFLAAMPWLRAYQVERAPVLLFLAAVLPVAISSVLARALRATAVVSYIVSSGGLVLLLAASNGFDVPGIWNGLVHVPAQLLTITLPLSGATSLLAAPIVLTWLCAAATTELLGRPTRPLAVGVAVPVVYFSLSFAATTSAPPAATVAEGAALLAALVVCSLCRQALLDSESVVAQEGTRAGVTQPARRSSVVRRGSLGAGLAIAMALVLAVVIPTIPALAAKPSTVARPTQVLSATVVDPLDALANLRRANPKAPARHLFEIQVQKAWSGYIPLATLDQYDGDFWTSAGTFKPTGGRVPYPSAQVTQEPGDQQLVQEYTLESPIGLPFLPALDRPEQVGGLAVDADSATGMLTASPTYPASYTVISEVPAGTIAGLPSASALATGTNVPGGDSPTYTSLPAGSSADIATAVKFAVNLTSQPASPSLAFLQALVSALHAQDRRIDPRLSAQVANPAALAGTSLAQVMNAVTVDRAATPEQFATFFAVVARYLGVPARVVTGFRDPLAATTGGVVPAGSYTITNRNAWTWDEVPVLGQGWVPVDPTPVLTTADSSAPPEQVTATKVKPPKQTTALPGNGAAHAIAKPVTVALKHPLNINLLVVLGIGGPLVLLAALFFSALVLPAVRRRLRRMARHRSHDPAALTAGAWLELIDGLFRLGVHVDLSATGSEVVSEVADRFGEDFGPATSVVAALADQALYSTQWPVDDAGAQLAWDTQRQLYRALRSSVGQMEKAKALALVGSSPARPTTGGTR